MSGMFSLSHMVVVGIVILLFFGKGKVSGIMGEVGQGLSAFKKGLREAGAEDIALADEHLNKK